MPLAMVVECSDSHAGRLHLRSVSYGMRQSELKLNSGDGLLVALAIHGPPGRLNDLNAEVFAPFDG
jgi:hypothetical protein